MRVSDEAFNRTIVELKLRYSIRLNQQQNTFNRTIVELKCCLISFEKSTTSF